MPATHQPPSSQSTNTPSPPPPPSIETLDRRLIWHPFTQMKQWEETEPLVIHDGQGAILRDSKGREYIDGNSSIWTNIHGHRHPIIDSAIRSQLDRIAHISFLGTTHEPAVLLAKKLINLLPKSGLTRVFYSDNGSTAIEVAIKMSIQYWQLSGQPHRQTFITFDHAYHGDTCGAASLGGLGTFFSRFDTLHFKPLRLPSPAHLETIPSPHQIAAVIIEPLVQGAAGIRLWPQGTMRQLRHWCDQYGALLIYDEVLTGFGRTGKMFACQHENAYPDFLCLAKGLSGGYLPIAATLTTDKIYSAFLGDFSELKTFFYGHSYCANPLACAAALGNLAAFQHDRTLEKLPHLINSLAQALQQLSTLPCVLETRQCGLISGIELCNPDKSPLDWRHQTGWRVCMAARNHGLLTRNILDTIVLMPPLCITTNQIQKAAQAIANAIHDVLGHH